MLTSADRCMQLSAGFDADSAHFLTEFNELSTCNHDTTTLHVCHGDVIHAACVTPAALKS